MGLWKTTETWGQDFVVTNVDRLFPRISPEHIVVEKTKGFC
jgi:hypothetical protein